MPPNHNIGAAMPSIQDLGQLRISRLAADVGTAKSRP